MSAPNKKPWWQRIWPGISPQRKRSSGVYFCFERLSCLKKASGNLLCVRRAVRTWQEDVTSFVIRMANEEERRRSMWSLSPQRKRSSGVFQRRAESIAEVLVAVTILVAVVTAAWGVLSRAVSFNIDISKRIEALNMAQEGLEATRNIRDTNWLKYSGDRRNKWRCNDTAAEPSRCEGAADVLDMIDTGYYKVDYDTTLNRYFLDGTDTQSALDITTATDFSGYRLYRTSTGRLTHTTTGNIPTSFFRQVRIEVLNPFHNQCADEEYVSGGCTFTAPSFCDDTTNLDDCGLSKMRAVVTLQWKPEREGSHDDMQELRLETHLFDYLERESYEP